MSVSSLVYYLVVFLLMLRKSASQDIYLNGALYANNSVVFFDEIGEEEDSLQCRTPASCCKTSAAGEWHYPDGRTISKKSAGEDFYRTRDDSGNVMLNRRNNAQQPKGMYTCVVPNLRGVLTTLAIALFSPEDYPEVIEHPQSQLNVDPGEAVTFSVVGERSSSYSWYHNGTTIPPIPSKYSGRRHSTLTIFRVSATDAGSYSCVVGNRILSVLSNEAHLTLLPPPRILAGPQDAFDVNFGSDVSFSITAEGLRLQYAWQREDGTALADRVEGQDTSRLTIRNVEFSDAGLYLCAVSNAAGITRSTEATLTVNSRNQVESLTITADITSAQLSWSLPSTIGQVLRNELQYYPTAFPSASVTLNTTHTSYEVTRLIPQLQYLFRVRVYTDLGHGSWVEEGIFLDKKIPAVQNISMTVVDSSSVDISWRFPTNLPGWNVSYYQLTYTAYLPNKAPPKTTFTRRVDGSRSSEVLGVDKLAVSEGVTHSLEVIVVLEIEGLEGIEEVRGEKAVMNTSLEYEKLPFQVMIGPVQHCISWEEGRSVRIMDVLHEALLAAINSRCNCSIPDDSISSGVFSCRSAKNAVTYRSTVTGLNATEMVEYIQDWVNTETTVMLDWYIMDVYSFCPVKISELDEPDCQFPSAQTFSLQLK